MAPMGPYMLLVLVFAQRLGQVFLLLFVCFKSAQTWDEEAMSRQTGHPEVLEGEPHGCVLCRVSADVKGGFTLSLRPSSVQLCF